MCDCDCELPKRERWQQIREEALDGHTPVPKAGVWIVQEGRAKRVEMPEAGEWLIMDNEIREVVHSERVDYAEDCIAYTVWVERDE